MTEVRVAVIIPCFNDGATIRESIASARAQEACEIVIVDDGSTDSDTLEVLSALEAEEVSVERRANAGSPAARMAGVARSISRYVLPLDADDCLEPGAVTLMADYLDANPDVAAVWGDLQLFGGRTHVRSKADELDPWLVTFINDQPSGALVRRDVLLEVGGWSAPCERLQNCSWDWNFWMALAEHGHRGRNVGAVTIRYRVRDGVNKGCLEHQVEIYASLRSRHPDLFAKRALNQRRSALPRSARLGVQVVQLVPGLRLGRRKRLATVICHLAYRRGGYLRPARRRLAGRAARARSRKPVT